MRDIFVKKYERRFFFNCTRRDSFEICSIMVQAHSTTYRIIMSNNNKNVGYVELGELKLSSYF